MPRKPRFNLIGIPQHLIKRGNHYRPTWKIYVNQPTSFNVKFTPIGYGLEPRILCGNLLPRTSLLETVLL